MERGTLKLVLEHHLFVVVPLLTGVLVFLRRDRDVHTECPPYLVERLKVVAKYMAFRELDVY